MKAKKGILSAFEQVSR